MKITATTSMSVAGVESVAYGVAADLTSGPGRVGRAAERVAGVALARVHDAFLDKADGHADEGGLQWPDVTDYTLRHRKNPKYRARSAAEPHTILVDTETLERSLAPNPTRDAPSGNPGQVYRREPGAVVVGTEVEYARKHHEGDPAERLPQRRLWPEELPPRWTRDMAVALAEEIAQEIAARMR